MAGNARAHRKRSISTLPRMIDTILSVQRDYNRSTASVEEKRDDLCEALAGRSARRAALAPLRVESLLAAASNQIKSRPATDCSVGKSVTGCTPRVAADNDRDRRVFNRQKNPTGQNGANCISS